jgi:hypothetical protein
VEKFSFSSNVYHVALPMSYYTCYDKTAGYHMYYNPKGFKKQGYSSFSQREYRNIWAILIGFAHQVPSCSGPNAFQ